MLPIKTPFQSGKTFGCRLSIARHSSGLYIWEKYDRYSKLVYEQKPRNLKCSTIPIDLNHIWRIFFSEPYTPLSMKESISRKIWNFLRKPSSDGTNKQTKDSDIPWLLKKNHLKAWNFQRRKCFLQSNQCSPFVSHLKEAIPPYRKLHFYCAKSSVYQLGVRAP